jgi:hypothetical protein
MVDQAVRPTDQCVEHIPTLLPGGREKRPNQAKILGAMLGAETARNLLAQFHHASAAFRKVIGEGHAGTCPN